ncbi:MAG: hypothetical protein ACOYJC_08590 [Christensenellales bacterium]|jgi:hypothetical protein
MPDQNDQASLLAFAVHGEKGCKATQWVTNDAEAIIAYIEEQGTVVLNRKETASFIS